MKMSNRTSVTVGGKYTPISLEPNEPSDGLHEDIESNRKTDKPIDSVTKTFQFGKFSFNIPKVTFLESWDQCAVFISYISLYLVYGSWVHIHQNVKYSPTMMVMSVLMTKLVVSVAAYRIFDGTFRELLSSFMANTYALVLYIFPAFAYATTDSLGVYCLRRLDVSTFSILYNIRVVFMLLLFQRFMRIPLQAPHWLAMALVVAGCTTKELPKVLFPVVKEVSEDALGKASAADSLGNEMEGVHLTTVFILIVMAQLAAFAAVYNEKLLKEQKLSLNIQNIAMYTWAIVATSLFSIFVPLLTTNGGHLLTEIGDPDQWATIWSYPIIIAVFLSAAYGLVTSFFIKSLNNVVREIACSLHIIGTIPINYFVFGYSFGLADFLAICLVICGVSIYNRFPLKK